MEAIVCHYVFHNIPMRLHSLICKCSLQWVIDLVGGLWLLLHYQYWIFSRTPWISHCCTVSWRSCSFESAGLPFDILQHLIDGVDVGAGQLRALDPSLGSSWAAQPTSSPTHTPPGTSSPVLPQLAHPMIQPPSCWASSLAHVTLGPPPI